MRHRLAPLALLLLPILAGCALRAEREALRTCQFSPRGFEKLDPRGDSARYAIAVEIHNPGPRDAVLDPAEADLFVGAPLAHLSHARRLRIPAGATDTAHIEATLRTADLVALGLRMTFSRAPDSLVLAGRAVVPRPLGLGTSSRKFRTSLPWSRVADASQGYLEGLFRSRP